MNTLNSQTRGVFYMLLASFLFATGGLVLKWTDWNPLAINGIRSVFGAIVIGCFMRLAHRKIRMNRTVFFGAAAYMLMTTLFVLSNKMTAAGNAIVLQFSCPIWIMLLSWILFQKKPAHRQIIALILILAGILCFFIDSFGSGNWLGDLFAIVSGFFYAVLFMLNSLPGGDALSSVLIGQIAAFVCMAPFSASCSWTAPNLCAIAWLGTFQVGAAYLFFSLGTSLISPLQASLINAVEPVLNPLMVALAGYEQLSGFSLAGAAIVIAAVVWNSLPQKQKQKTNTALRPGSSQKDLAEQKR